MGKNVGCCPGEVAGRLVKRAQVSDRCQGWLTYYRISGGCKFAAKNRFSGGSQIVGRE